MAMTPENEKEIEMLKMQKEIWAKAVDTQMHFNEMSVKSRQLGLSFVVGALALASILLGRQEPFFIPVPFTPYQTHVAGVIILIAAAGLWAVQRLDLKVYHQMLRGAVTFGNDLEKKVLRGDLMKTYRGMTEFITMYSRHRVDEKKDKDGNVVDYVPDEKSRENAETKLWKFYWTAIAALIAIGIVLVAASWSVKEVTQKSPPATAGQKSGEIKPPSQTKPQESPVNKR